VTAAERRPSLTARLSDAVNPIVVKEARQAVRSRSLLGGVFLLIGVFIVVSGAVTMLSDVRDNPEQGVQLFGAINSILIFFGIVIAPVYAATRFSSDRSGPSADLLHTTTLRPASIVLGKLAVAAMLAVMLVSIAAPFLSLTYLLRGIDLPTIAFWAVFDFIVICIAAMIGVFIAALPISRVFKALIGLALLPVMFWATSAPFTMFFGFGNFSVTMFTADQWRLLAVILGVLIAAAGVLVCLAIAAAAPNAANRARLPRAYLTLFWAATFWVVVWLREQPSIGSAEALLEFWAYAWTIVASAAIALSTGERRTINLRLRTAVPRRRLLRPLAWLFTSGAAPGFVWSALLAAATIAVLGALQKPIRPVGAGGHVEDLAVLAAWFVAYAMLGVHVRDRLASRWIVAAATPALVFGLAALGCLIPFLIAFGQDPSHWERQQYAALLNPFGAMLLTNSRGDGTVLVTAIIAAALLTALNTGWILAQVRQYAPIHREPAPTGATVGAAP